MGTSARVLAPETAEGELGLVIDYEAGRDAAVDVLAGAIGLIDALDELDRVLLSSIDTSLEPVSILNDVARSSLKMLLGRALRGVPDEYLKDLNWRSAIGDLLIKGKYGLLGKLDADAPEIALELDRLAPEYEKIPDGLVSFVPPSVSDVVEALHGVKRARSRIAGGVKVQTELGDIDLHDAGIIDESVPAEVDDSMTQRNRGTEFFRVKSPDMIGRAQWALVRAGRMVRATVLHQAWLDAYHARKIQLLPGDSLLAEFEETVFYDSSGTELKRELVLLRVDKVVSPPKQSFLDLGR